MWKDDQNAEQKSAQQAQNGLVAMFRAGELQRRQERQTYLLAQLKNENALQLEHLTTFDKEKHAEAVDRLQTQVRQMDKEIRGGYWRRLWDAICNK